MLNSRSTHQNASTSESSSQSRFKVTNQRVLCFILHPLSKVAEAKLKPSLAEVFLQFSPRVQYREPNYIFIDVGSTAHLFGGEGALLNEAVALNKELGFNVQAAISDTPSGAHAIARSVEYSSASYPICHPGRERETLQHLSLPFLLHLEGLKPWAKPHTVEQLIRFFRLLGLNEIGDLKKISYLSFKERWGDTGASVWRRIRVLEKQVISPLKPSETLQEYVYLDFPIGLLPLLLHQTNKAAEFLFARLQSRRLYAQKLILTLRCEYSQTQYKIELEPNKPSRDLSLFMSLLEHKLEAIDLENPIRDFEIEVTPCPENSRQFDFFEPRATAEERLDQLLSILKQAQVKAGLFEVYAALLPEKSFSLCGTAALGQEFTSTQHLQTPRLQSSVGIDVGEITTDLHHRNLSISPTLNFKNSCKTPDQLPFESKEAEISLNESGHQQRQSLPTYSKDIMESPRPTRLLKKPRALTAKEISRIHLLSRNPLERIQLDWWDPPPNLTNAMANTTPAYRDYYFAINDEGQCLWVYKEGRSAPEDNYYLHGYFD